LIYAKMGPELRSTEKVAKKCRKAHSLTQRWCQKHHWVERARAYDAEQERIEQAELVQARKEAIKRHVELGQLMQEKGAKRLRDKKFKVQSVKDTVSIIKGGAALEAAALGLNRPTEQPAVTIQVGLLEGIALEVNAFRERLLQEFNQQLASGEIIDAETITPPNHNDSTCQGTDVAPALPEPEPTKPDDTPPESIPPTPPGQNDPDTRPPPAAPWVGG
jgi:hypothetical protein